MKLEKYSLGMGDRFGLQGRAQLEAIIKVKEMGIDVVPVWNKSHREHTTIGTSPKDTRIEADNAVKAKNWSGNYYVDADHINQSNVDLFMDSSNFYTLDVADEIGKKAADGEIETFIDSNQKYLGQLNIPGIEQTFQIDRENLRNIAHKYLQAVKEAGNIYRKIAENKGSDNFVTEVSMDETDNPQTPLELLFILQAISAEKIPAQTIAPKFSGRFNKGVDYVGDIKSFTSEFEQDLAVIQFAIREFALPDSLKLSVHSGSDKFAIYKPINRALKKFNAGLHLKTAGTTWLEELIGLAEAGGEGLSLAKEVYANAFKKYDELVKPYATVIDIDQQKLPDPATVLTWDSEQYTSALRHNQTCDQYNQHFRQLLHVGYKVAALMGDTYLSMVQKFEESTGRNVCENLLERHLKPLLSS